MSSARYWSLPNLPIPPPPTPQSQLICRTFCTRADRPIMSFTPTFLSEASYTWNFLNTDFPVSFASEAASHPPPSFPSSSSVLSPSSWSSTSLWHKTILFCVYIVIRIYRHQLALALNSRNSGFLLAAGEAYKAIFWSTPGFTYRTVIR